MALSRCCGTTRKGARCSITASSGLTDNCGRLIASPLLHGGSFCRFHARPFCALPAEHLVGSAAVVLLLDLETTGVDVANDQIVELAAYHAPKERHVRGAAFSTVVKPSVEDSAGHIHGIGPNELSQGLPFGVAWSRFLDFVVGLQRVSIASADHSDSEDDGTSMVVLPFDAPTVVLVGHNSFRFDFPMLLFECLRHGRSLSPFEDWLFVDSLSIVQCVVAMLGGCAKLQCLVRGHCAEFQAHRALDDCIALRAVLQHLADLLGIPVLDVLRPFAMKLDANASLAQMSAM